MLSIGAMSSGQCQYYLELAREDYYLEGGEPKGLWFGDGAKELQLAGEVESHDLKRLFDGYAPGTESGQVQNLVQNAGRENRQPGWDLCFSAPKSVSVLWSQASPEVREAIQKAHFEAVKAALSYIEKEAAFTRTGRWGKTRERASLVVAAFEHGTSRALEPQLHTHCLVLNVGVCSDGKTRTIVSKPFYIHKMTVGALYRTHLAACLSRRLGVQVETKRTWFEVQGVSDGLMRFFSTRRKEVEAKLKEFGVETASASAAATLKTREVKKVVPPRDKLFSQWRKAGKEFSFGKREVQSLLGKRVRIDRKSAYEMALNRALDKITQSKNHFTERELVKYAAQAAQAYCLEADFLTGSIKHDLKNSDRFILLGERVGESRYTTKEILELEAKLLEAARSLKGSRVHILDNEKLKRTISQNTLDPEQEKALRHLTRSKGSIKILSGIAGSGKTHTLNALREAYEKRGYTVLGAAIGGKAAKELEAGSGISSQTIKLLQMRLEPSVGRQLKHHTRQLVRAAKGKKTYRLDRLKLDEKTVLVIDEAGMVPTETMAKLVEVTKKHGSKLILAGEYGQLSPIDGGSALKALQRELGCSKLDEIRRQRSEKDRQVVKDFRSGDSAKALKSLTKRGLVSVQETRQQAIQELVSDWSAAVGGRPQDGLIFCGTRKEADDLNRHCQMEQSLSGRVDKTQALTLQDGFVYKGDRVLFTKNSYPLLAFNGELGTVIAVHERKKMLSIKKDDGQIVVLPLKDYVHDRGERKGQTALELGYAVTTHKGQGTTVEKAFVLAGGSMQDREISYVQASRARGLTRIYSDKIQAGEELTKLARQMRQSRAKDLAHDVLSEKKEIGYER